MKTITYVLLFATMDMVPTFFLWALSPTDSVRVWYPTLVAYAGEHFVTAAATFLVGWLLLRAVRVIRSMECRYRPTLMRAFVFGSVCLAVDVCASAELAFLQSGDNGVIHLWHTQTLTGYLVVRQPLYVAFAAVLLIVTALRMRGRRVVTPALPV